MSLSRLSLVLAGTVLIALVSPASTASASSFPDKVPLPTGSLPEGITSGPGTTYYAGSRKDGTITVGDLRTGSSRPLVAGITGRVAVGLRYDDARKLLWVAGGRTGAVTAYDTRDGREVARYVVSGNRFLNDVEVTRGAVYVTDSLSNELVVIRDGQASLLAVTGDLVLRAGNNANGIRALPSGDLLITQSNTGDLLRVDPATGVADTVELSGPDLTAGDGLELVGSTLYVVYGFARNSIAVVQLDARGRSGAVTGERADSDLDRPTTTTLVAGALWTVNGRFSPTPTAETTFDVVRVAR